MMMKVEPMNNRNMRTISEPQGYTHNRTFYSCGSNVPLAPLMEDIRGDEAFIFFSPTAKGYENGNCFAGEHIKSARVRAFRSIPLSYPTPPSCSSKEKGYGKKRVLSGGSAGEDHVFDEGLYPTPHKNIWKAH